MAAGFKSYDKTIIWINNHIALAPLIFLIACAIYISLLFVFFLIFTRKFIKYFNSIIKELQGVDHNKIDINIPVETNDELGLLASSINTLSQKLSKAIEDERNVELTKNELINNISHDLRTPLTSIMGYMELLINHNYPSSEEYEKYMNIVYKKCSILCNLVNDLFDYCQINYKGVILKTEKIDIIEVLQQIIIGFIPMFINNGMEYRMNHPQERIFIEADCGLIIRLFENLIKNALSYGQDGKFIDINISKDEHFVFVKVINYGEPIPENKISNIFDRFYRIEKSRSKNSDGSGLGLAIVKSIVELHNGIITAKSNSDCTVFEVRLNLVLQL